jgi:hypothetical protein
VEAIMNLELKQKVDLMVNNYLQLKKSFKWDMNLIRHFGALIHAGKGKEVNVEKIEEVKKYIKEQTRWTSYFRGSNEFLIANLLCFEEDYRSFFINMQEVYEKMIGKGFKKSTQLPLAAYTFAKEVDRVDWEYKLNRMNDFYNKMKENHYWLTSADDYVFAAVLAATDLNVLETTRNMEGCYSYLNDEGFYKGNELQTLSHILALGEETTNEKCRKAISIYKKLKEKDYKLQYQGLATLGLLSLVAPDEDKIVYDIKEIYDYIYEKDGYGFWSLDKSTRIILACTLVSDFYVDEIKKGVFQIALGNSINAIIIAQQQAAIAACAACSAAAASASS